MAGGGTKAVVAALLANTGIAVTKFAAWGLTQSASMLAEAIHSLADAGNQVLLLVGGKRAQREANELHQFGFGRERYVYSFIVAIVLFSVGGLFALYEGYHKVHDPHAIEHWKWVPVAVLEIAIIMESLSFRTAIIEANKLRGHVSWTRFVRNARAPELPVILLEDFAALTGLALALIGVALTLATGNGVFDGLGSMAIGALLVCVAIRRTRHPRSRTDVGPHLPGARHLPRELHPRRAPPGPRGPLPLTRFRRQHAGAAEPAESSLAVDLGLGGWCGEPAGPVAEVADVRGDRRLGQGPEREGQRRRRHVVPVLEVEGELDGRQVAFVVLALGVVPGTRARQQAEGLPVAQHARGGAELAGGLGDAHAAILTFRCQEGPPAGPGTVRHR